MELTLRMLSFDTNCTFIHFRYGCVLGYTYEECVIVYDPIDQACKDVVEGDSFFTGKAKFSHIACPKCRQWLEGDVPALLVATMLNRI